MNINNEYQNEYPEMLRDEIDRAFGEILEQQVKNNQHQLYYLSLGTPIVKNIKLEIRTLPDSPEAKVNPLKRRKYFSLEFTPDVKHGFAFLDLVMFLRSDNFRGYFTSQKGWDRRKNDPEFSITKQGWKLPSSMYSISWEFLESDTRYLLGILKEMGQTIGICRWKVDSKKIGYLSGNLLARNQQIPVVQPKIPTIKNGVSLDIYHTIEEQNMKNPRTSPSAFRNGQYRHPQTAFILAKIRAKSKLLLSLRDPSYTNEMEKDQILSDYYEAWKIILPDEVCRFLMNHRENDGFEFELGYTNLSPLYLRIGELQAKEEERIIGFSISVNDTDADILWDELAENFKKYHDEVGNYEFEITHPNDYAEENVGKATIILEMPISFRQPEKIRNMLTLLGTLLFKHGYTISQSPRICNGFDNPKGKLQSIAKKSLPSPKIKPSSDR